MKKRLPFLIIAVLIIAAMTAWFLVFKEKDDPNIIRVSGNIEVTDMQLGFKIAGRLEARFVDEGDKVARGALLARLENVDQKISVALARANLVRVKSFLSELEAGSRPQEILLSHARVLQARQVLLELTNGTRIQEIEKSRSTLDTALAGEKSARTQLKQAKSDYKRFAVLFKEKSISQRDFELFRTQYEIARDTVSKASANVGIARQALSLKKEGPRPEQIEKARAALIQAKAEYTLVKAGPRKEKIDQAKALVEEAREKLKQAEQVLSYTELIAPMAGVILSKSAEPGEYLNPATPVVTLGDLQHPWMRAYVTEKDLGRIRLKESVMVTNDSFPDKKYKGILTFISSQAEFTPKSVQTFEERVKLMFRITVTLPNPDEELKPGMPADGVIQVSEDQE